MPGGHSLHRLSALKPSSTANAIGRPLYALGNFFRKVSHESRKRFMSARADQCRVKAPKRHAFAAARGFDLLRRYARLDEKRRHGLRAPHRQLVIELLRACHIGM